MAIRVNTDLLNEIKQYGDVNVEDCFNCGNCTAVCPLSTDETPFPRNNMRLLQLGLKDSILQNMDPWLCYYCGECTETCPREAEPAEAQMAMRRWLTAQYDWTGLSQKLYTSRAWRIAALLFAAILTIVLAMVLRGPMNTDYVALNAFAPVEVVHAADLILAGVLSLFLLSNVFRMYLFAFRDAKVKVPLPLFIAEAWHLVLHLITQKRYGECDDKIHWINHLIMVAGYGTMFLLIVVFLPWFQTDAVYPIYHPQRLIGYLAALAIIYGTGNAIVQRIRQKNELHRYSTASDWLFPVLLLLLAASGLLISMFRVMGMPMPTYYTYVAHLVIMMALYVTVGPMGKWGHILYRPIAIYFQAVKEKAIEQSKASAQAAAAVAD